MSNFKRKKKRPMQKQRHTFTSGEVIAKPQDRKMRDRVADEIDAAMAESGVTRSELARRLKVTRGAVTHMLNPKSNPTVDAIERVASALGRECRITLNVPA